MSGDKLGLGISSFNEAGAEAPDHLGDEAEPGFAIEASMRPGRKPRIIPDAHMPRNTPMKASMRPGRKPRIIARVPVSSLYASITLQ